MHPSYLITRLLAFEWCILSVLCRLIAWPSITSRITLKKAVDSEFVLLSRAIDWVAAMVQYRSKSSMGRFCLLLFVCVLWDKLLSRRCVISIQLSLSIVLCSSTRLPLGTWVVLGRIVQVTKSNLLGYSLL